MELGGQGRLGEVLRAMVARGDPPTASELSTLIEAGAPWADSRPGLLGALFQAALAAPERRRRAAHYTPEAAILDHVVRPCLVDPWRARMAEASTLDELTAVRAALGALRVLDPACGSGNFLHVAHHALVELDRALIEIANRRFGAGLAPATIIRADQLLGIDKDPFAVALAKVTLLIADRQARGEARSPESLDASLRCDDALFCDWPAADVILGNPPFQSKNKVARELGADYVARLRSRHPGVPGRADHCVYWIRRAHDELAPGGRAGLVGTNTIRQNYSREGGLDHVVKHGGTIFDAVSTMVWPGDATVHVSVVSWIKGDAPGPKRLAWQEGGAIDGPWRERTLDHIPASLTAHTDVTGARRLSAVAASGACRQGQTHGHDGFLLSPQEAASLCRAAPANREVIFPYLVGEDMLTREGGAPARWIIDFHPRAEEEARRYELPFARVARLVLPDRERAAERERARRRPRGKRHHEGFLRRYWLLSYPRPDLVRALGRVPRYIACSRIMKRPIFAFVSSAIRPGDALTVFPLADDYSFGVLQSGMHTAWIEARGSTMKGDGRYTSSTVFDSFPWPQGPSAAAVQAVAERAAAVRAAREGQGGLRALYAAMPGPLAAAHAALDAAVREAYGVGTHEDPLGFLLDLNLRCAAREADSEAVIGPGLPPGIDAANVVTGDAIQPVER